MSNEEKILTAVIYSAAEPSKEQKARFGQFLKNKYGSDIPLQWEMSDAFPGGFRLEV
jgi:F0F1-type ATP synthase delta subunit